MATKYSYPSVQYSNGKLYGVRIDGRGVIVWTCNHRHQKRATALECARKGQPNAR
jgi:hypothetical protein